MTDRETALNRVKSDRAWKVNVYITDRELEKRIRYRAIEDGMKYNEMFLTGIQMYLASRRTDEVKDNLVP